VGRPLRRANQTTIPQSRTVRQRLREWDDVSGGTPRKLKRASSRTHRKLVYPSTRSNPGLNTRPWPSAKFRAYRNEMKASSVRNRYSAPWVSRRARVRTSPATTRSERALIFRLYRRF